MPHAHPMPAPGFQALIFCGPGLSLTTFTSSPEDFPKALIPIANRPMVWYPLVWCYRMGITNIHLIVPPSSRGALNAALSTNPDLTALPAPKATILSPSGITQNTGTAEILRMPEIRAAIEGDFVILPCDLVCSLPGESFLETWMVKEGGFGGIDGSLERERHTQKKANGNTEGRRGGLGVWYHTKGADAVKGEESDFIATAPSFGSTATPSTMPLLSHVSNLVYAAPMDSVNDITEEKGVFPIRHALLRKHGNIRFRTSYRDAHIYFFPYWILDVVAQNERLVSISEDLVGWWAKAGWQDGLGKKLGFEQTLQKTPQSMEDSQYDSLLDEEIDLVSMSSTITTSKNENDTSSAAQIAQYASRVQSRQQNQVKVTDETSVDIPRILAYIHPTSAESAVVRRVDTVPLLLSISLRLAKLPGIDEAGAEFTSPFAPATKIAFINGVTRPSTVTKGDCLLADNVTVAERAVIKECVIGMGCKIEKGARLTRCVLMEGAVISEQCQLTGCVLGRRCKIGKSSILKDCEVQDGYLVPENTDAKAEKYMKFDGFDDIGESEEETQQSED